MDSILKDIKAGKIKNLYLFYGEDAYKRKNYKELLTKALYSNEMNFSYFEGESIKWNQVYDSVVNLPFFADMRLVIVENCGKFKAKGSDSDDMILKILAELPETTCLAFFEEEAAKIKKTYKQIAKKEGAVPCEHDSEGVVAAWLAKGFEKEGKKISRADVRYIIEKAGVDYENLRCEFEKIISYGAQRDTITRTEIDAVIYEDTEAKIFDMLRACGEKNKKEMLRLYGGILENEIYPLVIFANIRSQFRLMLQIAELANKRLSDREIAAELKKSDFIIKKNKALMRNFRMKNVEDLLEEAALLDKKIKNGDMEERTAVEILLLEAAM